MNFEQNNISTFQRNEKSNIVLISQLNEDILTNNNQINAISNKNKSNENIILEKQHSKNQLAKHLNILQQREKVNFYYNCLGAFSK